VDSTALHRVAQGEKAVMMRKSDPDEKDYAFAVVIDRSGSMSGGEVKEAEEVAVTLGKALEDVGADVMVTSLKGNMATLEKPFGVDFEARQDTLVNAQAGGGTPRDQALRVVRERSKQYPTTAQKAVMGIPDRRPSDTDAYEDALDRMTDPVIGVQLTNGSGAGEAFYHRYVTAQPGSGELKAKLQELIQEAMDL
jgi:Mg-chelatase subunit ChlD